VGTAELESIHSRGRQKRPWRASDGRVDQLLRELRRRAGAWIRLLGRPEDIVRVACRLATWDADRATPDAVVREALADDGDLDGDRSDRAIALGEHAVPALRRALEAGEPAARCRAARLLAAIGDASGVHVLAAAIIGDGGDGGDADHAADIYGGVDSERYAIVEELEGLGARALEPLLEVLHHAGADPDQRWLALEALVGIEVRDDRIRDALIRELEIDSGAASLLAQYGDGGPVVAEAIRLALARRIDQLADDLDVALKHDELRALLEAARALGALSPELTDLLEVALDKARVEDAWEDGARDEGDGDPGFEDEAAFRVRAAVRPGRNEPCWCGSGQKYKRCHLDSDAECDRIGRL
jgi:hypothetical protein